MNYSDSQSEPPGSTQLSTGNGHAPNKEKPKWTLTPEAFDKLLNAFSEDRDEAGIQYELARRRLVRFFEWRGIGNAEECADETLNRVARRIDEGQKIDKLMPFIYGVAHNILLEENKRRERAPIDLDHAPPEGLVVLPPEPVDPDLRLSCLDHCMEELGLETANVILGYYEGQGRVKIENRRKLADKLQIPLNALRIRVCRNKRTLEDCITECMEKTAARKD